MRPFLYFILAFVICVPVGTISHEFGHYVVADYFDYEASLHFDRVNYNIQENNDELLSIYSENKEAIDNNWDFDGMKDYYASRSRYKREYLLMALGGVLQTVITGSLGFILLYKRRRDTKRIFDNKDWLFLFVTLFWLRQIFNVISSLLKSWYFDIDKYCGGDELRISLLLELPLCLVSYALGFVSLIICGYSFFVIMPREYRIEFIAAGILGSGLGYYLWMKVLGPVLLP